MYKNINLNISNPKSYFNKREKKRENTKNINKEKSIFKDITYPNNQKHITIKGKNNIDKFNKNKPTRIITEKWSNIITDDLYNDFVKQKLLIQQLFLIQDKNNISNKERNYYIIQILNNEIKNKHYNYKQQDLNKECYDENYFITIDNILELLISSKLLCHYCKSKLHIFYKNSHEPTQWTLDRIDNNYGHNHNNCVISCLKCNIQRKVMNKDRFLYSKQMKINKVDS